MNKKVVVVGASPNPNRYSFMAAELLDSMDYDFVPIGIKKGRVSGKPILDIRTLPEIEDVDTITLYIRAEWQEEWEQYFFSLKPKRIIFNPGAENPVFEKRAREFGIETVEACTLVMLRTGQF
jgi:predicted CoA-binding protein